jgi:hypothetical protein
MPPLSAMFSANVLYPLTCRNSTPQLYQYEMCYLHFSWFLLSVILHYCDLRAITLSKQHKLKNILT